MVKRQREQAKRDRQQRKEEKRVQRKAEKESGGTPDVDSDLVTASDE